MKIKTLHFYYITILVFNLVAIFYFKTYPITILLTLFLPLLWFTSKCSKELGNYLEKWDLKRYENESYYYSTLDIRYYNTLNAFGGVKTNDSEELKNLYSKTKFALSYTIVSFILFIILNISYSYLFLYK
jgi:hypothetical protein